MDEFPRHEQSYQSDVFSLCAGGGSSLVPPRFTVGFHAAPTNRNTQALRPAEFSTGETAMTVQLLLELTTGDAKPELLDRLSFLDGPANAITASARSPNAAKGPTSAATRPPKRSQSLNTTI
jgi:hypothetical protein